MAEVTAVTNEEQQQYGFAGTAVYPHSQAGRGTLRGVSINTNDPEILGSPKPFQVDGPGAGVDVSEDFK
jgi:hypothetical protein